MKFILVLAIVFCAFQSTLGQTGEVRNEGYVIMRSIGGRAVQDISNICNSADKISQQFCNGATNCESTGVVTCTSNGGGYLVPCGTEKPNCIASTDATATCSGSLPAGCTAVPPAFTCTGVGYYPDPSNCRLFYYCGKDAVTGALKPQARGCDPGYVFDPNSPTNAYCLYSSVASRCVTVSAQCAGSTSAKYIAMSYYNNAQFVAMCVPAGETLVFQCPTGTKPDLTTTPLTCPYQCKTTGMFPYSLDNVSYYLCGYNAALKLYAKLEQCPEGQVFSKTQCV